MSPYRFDSGVDYRRLRQLSIEFTHVWKQLQGLYLDAAAGFGFVRRHVEEDQRRSRAYVQRTELDSGEFQDTRLFTYQRIFSGSFCTSAVHQTTQGEVKARNAPNGANFALMAQLCLVSFYDYWNEYLRRELVVAKGKLDPSETSIEIQQRALQEHASHELWGDILSLAKCDCSPSGYSNFRC